MTKKVPLLAGAWIGEFGWELFNFQAYVRALADSNKFSEVIVCTRPGNEYLYDDIIIEHGGKVITNRFPYDSINMWRNDDVDLDALMQSGSIWNLSDGYWFRPLNYMRGIPGLTPRFVKYRFKTLTRNAYPQVLIHARNAHHCNSGFRNWYYEHACEVAHRIIAQGFTVASIGLSETSHMVDGTVDVRDISVELLVEIMNRAKIIVGSLSGCIHLATLSDLPQVTWVTHIHHEIRARQTWNPFGVPVTVFRSPTNDYWRHRKPWTPLMTDIVIACFRALDGVFDV